ncbi:MAG: hypothetical protein IIY78_02420 [Clostridia bacterium]|nr:hypothetical protein [Clostridia bacterium]
MTELEKARKTMEQTLMPQMFAMEKANLLNSILDKEGKFFTDVMAIYLGVVNDQYKADDFKVYLQRAKSEEMLFDFVVVKTPVCGTAGIADTMYFCLEETTGEISYLVAEKSLGGQRVLRALDEELPKDHGVLPEDADKEFQKMANIFIRRISGIS